MRLGKWIKVFHNSIPIPITFSASFGLREGSRLYLAPVVTGYPRASSDAEIIVSPVPTAAWRSVCRLSVRLHDRPHALAAASSFLRHKGINIILSEAAATFQERAHWDAVCDLGACPEFASIRNLTYEAYIKRMPNFLGELSAEFAHWAAAPSMRDNFLTGDDAHIEFSSLSGLNIASFRVGHVANYYSDFRGGSITIHNKLEREILTLLGGVNSFFPAIPSHALITGNTEQRYLRLYFIRNVSDFMMAEIGSNLSDTAAGGAGALGALLENLPPDLNLLHLSLNRIQTNGSQDTGITRIVGNWSGHSEKHMQDLVEALEFEDIEGKVHKGIYHLKDYATPSSAYPRVYVSYSTRLDEDRLSYLRNSLVENNFDPHVGTDLSESAMLGGGPVSPDVLTSAMNVIPTCVAFVSLQSKRSDFSHPDGRYTLPPWLIAEEVFAFSRNVRYLARIRERGVEDPRYNPSAFNYEFSDESQFRVCVTQLMRDLNAMRQAPEFANALRAARQAQVRIRSIPN